MFGAGGCQVISWLYIRRHLDADGLRNNLFCCRVCILCGACI